MANYKDQNLIDLLQDNPPTPIPPPQPKRLCSEFLSNYVNEDSDYISNCFSENGPSIQNKKCAACSLFFKVSQLRTQFFDLEGSEYYKMLIGFIGDYTTGFFLYLVGMYLISKKKFNRYPYRLFAMALLSQAVSNFNYVNQKYFVYPALYRIVAFTMRLSQINYFQFDDEDQLSGFNWKNFHFQRVTYQQQYKAFLLLIAVWKFITIMFQQVSLAINVCIYYDTYKILSNPFYPARKRQKFYILYVFIIIIATIIILFRSFFDWKSMSLVAFIPRQDKPFDAKIPQGNIINWFAVLIIIQLSIILICFFRTICILCRAGTSQQAKKRAMRFHFYYLFILIFSEVLNIQHTFTDYWTSQFNQYAFNCTLDENFNEQCDEYKEIIWLIIVRYIGIIQGILRLTDPFIFQEFKKDLIYTKNNFKILFGLFVQKICCCKQKKEQLDLQRKSMFQSEKILGFQLNQSQSLDTSQNQNLPITTPQQIRKFSFPLKKNRQKFQNKEKGKRKQKNLVQETINGFLNTAMNIEFVYTILLGINTYMECQIQSQNEKQEQMENYQNEKNLNSQSQIEISQNSSRDSQKEQLKKNDENLHVSQTTNFKKLGAYANYQVKQQDQAIKIKIMDVTMYDAQKFDVDQDFSEQNDSVLGQPFNHDYRLKDSPLRGQDKFDFAQDQIIFDQSLTKSNFDKLNLMKPSSSNNNQIQRMETAKFRSDQKTNNKNSRQETPAFQLASRIQQINEPKAQNIQMNQNNSFESSNKKMKYTFEDQNKISFDSEDLGSSKNQSLLKRQFSIKSDFQTKNLDIEKIESQRQNMSMLGQFLQINYGDKDQNDEQSATQSFSVHSNYISKPKKQNIIARILQLENKESYRLKKSDFDENIVFDPVEVTMKSGHNREVSLALRFMRPEMQQKESFFMPKVISVESRTNGHKKNQKNRNLSRQGRSSIQDKFFHEANIVFEDKQLENRNKSVFKRQLSNRSLGQAQLSMNYLKADSIQSTQAFDNSKLQTSYAKSEKEKTKMSIKLKTEIECLEPQKFAKIMEMDGINPQDVIKSLSIEANHKQLFKAGEGSGQSGSFFFFSWDKKLLIKTLRGQEKKNLLNMLDKMIDYFERVNNRSLLARIYGCFTIKSNYFPDLDVIVMQNATQLISPKLSDIVNFDLKGSTKGRKTRIQKEHEKFWKQRMNFKGTLKDLNLVEIMHDKGSAVIQITESQFDAFEYIIHRDSQFLRNHNLMDYSLLLTIEQLPCTKEQYDEQEKQFEEKKNQKINQIMPNKKLSDVSPANSNFMNNSFNSQNLKTKGHQTSIKDLLKATSITDLQEQSLRLHIDRFHIHENRSSLLSLDNQTTQKTKNSFVSKENNKSEYASELQNIKQEYKNNAQLRNFLKTQIIKEQLIRKDDLRKSYFIKTKQSQREKIDNSQREDTIRQKKSQPDQKRKKTFKKLGESYRSQEEEDEVEYKYYRQVAHLAIIDYLQEWSLMKKMENTFMRFTLSKQQINTISAVHPELYQSRFENFIVQQFLKPGKEKFMNQEKKNYSENCDEFIMNLAYDIRMSELEIDKIKKLNSITPQEDTQVKQIGEQMQSDTSKNSQQNFSFENMQQQKNFPQTQYKEIILCQSEEFVFENSNFSTPLFQKQDYNSRKSEKVEQTSDQNILYD